MAEIPFTQFLMPDGRKTTVFIDRPDAIAEKAQAIIASGLRFECEMLSDYRNISLTITDPNEGDLEIEVVPNGPEVPVAVDRLISRFIDARDNAAEAAWERQQQSLMESGGPDDGAYRRQVIEAGRGHLLR